MKFPDTIEVFKVSKSGLKRKKNTVYIRTMPMYGFYVGISL